MQNKNIIIQDSTAVVLQRSENLMNLTKSLITKKSSDLVASTEGFISIKAGSFMMGSDVYEDEQPIHKVTIGYDFQMGRCQVTIGEYMEFASQSGRHYPEWREIGNSYNLETGDDDYYKGQNLNNDAPIIGINADDARAYCQWRSDKERKHYRLPTEAEWEYACRAGTTTKYSFGDDKEKLGEYAWYDDNANGKAHPVGTKKPNPWGLYDMHGNVWEWCEDKWIENYDITPRDGSANKSGESSATVIRGGSWFNVAWYCRSAIRNSRSGRNDIVGFRVVLA